MLATILLLAGATPARSAGSSVRYYVVVRGVDESAGVASGMRAELQRMFVEELKKHPAFLLEAPPDLPSEPRAMAQALKRHHLKAFELTLKILEVKRAVEPPAPGKPYRRLERGIRLTVLGDTLPEKVIALGGDGESTIQAEIAGTTDIEVEGPKLLAEAARSAVTQAVDMTLAKLQLAEKPTKLRARPKR